MMSYLAAVLILIVGAAHSVLGERLVLRRLARLDNLPRLEGSRQYTMLLLRVAWHITTVAWLGFAAIFVLMAHDALTKQSASAVIAATFLISGVVALVASRGRHLSWVIFLSVGVIALLAAI